MAGETTVENETTQTVVRSRGAMKAMVQHGYGAPERVLRLEEVDRPSVGDGDVLVRVRATSVKRRTGSRWPESPTSSG